MRVPISERWKKPTVILADSHNYAVLTSKNRPFSPSNNVFSSGISDRLFFGCKSSSVYNFGRLKIKQLQRNWLFTYYIERINFLLDGKLFRFIILVSLYLLFYFSVLILLKWNFLLTIHYKQNLSKEYVERSVEIEARIMP